MFEEITDFNIDINSLLQKMDANCANAKELRQRLVELKNNLCSTSNSINQVSTPISDISLDNPLSFENEVSIYIELYRKINMTNIDELPTILPNEFDYHYNEILLRLCAESLKEIKECEELKLSENIEEDIELDTIIETEKRKIKFIKSLLEPHKDLTRESIPQNKIILAPNLNDNVSIFKDIERIPLEYYEEVSTLLESIINNTFKNFKRLTTMFEINGFCEVKGTKIRIVFKRLNVDTYALVTIFMKKTTTDNGYRDFIRGKISSFIPIIKLLKDNLDNPEFLEINDSYVNELYNKLKMNTPKERRM